MAKKAEKKMGEKAGDEAGKKEALDLALGQITKQFGDGSIMTLGYPFMNIAAKWSYSCPWANHYDRTILKIKCATTNIILYLQGLRINYN